MRVLQQAALSTLLCMGTVTAEAAPPGEDQAAHWPRQFAREVDRRLDVPARDQQRYIVLLQQALVAAQTPLSGAQAFVLIDSSPQVQAAFIVMRTAAGAWAWTGASPVSTGKAGSFDHFVTPLGVFAHTLDNPDFRAEGSFNEDHIRGYGLRGRRVFDFGWADAERGWGDGGTSQMRLQMHATDPSVLEPRLGRVESKGCIRIPASLNVFIDRHGILDADYEQAAAEGQPLWVLEPDREPIAAPGRYLVIIDSQTAARPEWSPLPGAKPKPVGNPAAVKSPTPSPSPSPSLQKLADETIAPPAPAC